jgi:hypothetical protein
MSLVNVVGWFKAGFTARADGVTIDDAISASGLLRQEDAVAAFSAGWNASNEIKSVAIGDFDKIRGVRKFFMNNGSITGGNWYWMASYMIAKKQIKEIYSIASWGEQEAQRLAVKARDDEMEFERRLNDPSLTAETRAAIESERDIARQARKRLREERGVFGIVTKAPTGVSFHARDNCWIAHWIDKGKRKHVYFPVRGRDSEEVKAEAIKRRKAEIAKIEGRKS